jgi:hypothetical protein
LGIFFFRGAGYNKKKKQEARTRTRKSWGNATLETEIGENEKGHCCVYDPAILEESA